MKRNVLFLMCFVHIISFTYFLNKANNEREAFFDKKRDLYYFIQQDSGKNIRAIYFPDGKIFVHKKYLIYQ